VKKKGRFLVCRVVAPRQQQKKRKMTRPAVGGHAAQYECIDFSLSPLHNNNNNIYIDLNLYVYKTKEERSVYRRFRGARE
jgi:hypothetical protein